MTGNRTCHLSHAGQCCYPPTEPHGQSLAVLFPNISALVMNAPPFPKSLVLLSPTPRSHALRPSCKIFRIFAPPFLNRHYFHVIHVSRWDLAHPVLIHSHPTDSGMLSFQIAKQNRGTVGFLCVCVFCFYQMAVDLYSRSGLCYNRVRGYEVHGVKSNFSRPLGDTVVVWGTGFGFRVCF